MSCPRFECHAPGIPRAITHQAYNSPLPHAL
jgi:hypothetical protein